MGCRILVGREQGTDFEHAALFCSTSDWVFGPLFYGDRELGLSAEEEADLFLRYVERPSLRENRATKWPKTILGMRGDDPRSYSDGDLEKIYSFFCTDKASVLLEANAEAEAQGAKA